MPASVPVAPSSTLSIAQTSACSRDGAPSSPSAKKHAGHTALGVATGSVKAAVKQSQQSIDPLESSEALMGHDAGHANRHLDANDKGRSRNLAGLVSPRAGSTIKTSQSPLGKGPCLRRQVGSSASSTAAKPFGKENAYSRVSEKEKSIPKPATRLTGGPSALLPVGQCNRKGVESPYGIHDGMRSVDFLSPSALHVSRGASSSEADRLIRHAGSPGDDAYVPFIP